MRKNRLFNFLRIVIVCLLATAFIGCKQNKKVSRKVETIEKKAESKSLAELQLDFLNTRYKAYFHYNMCTFKNLNSEEHFGRQPAWM